MSPIPVEALEREEVLDLPRPGSHPARVLAFLLEHRVEAWRAHELAAALDVEQHTIGAALRRLLARGLVEKKGRYWYALNERDAAQLSAALTLTRGLNERLGREDPRDWAHLPHE